MISPGTASTSRPSSSAKSAVISAPERSRASTTTVARASPAMIRFRAGKRHGAGSTPGSYSDTTSPPAATIAPRELGVRRRVVAVDAAAEHRDGRPARRERAAVRLAVDAARQAADDDGAGGRGLASRGAARPTRPYPEQARAPTIGDGRTVEELERRVAPHPETARRVGDLREQRRVAAVPAAKRRGSSRAREPRRGAVRERLGDVLRQHVGRARRAPRRSARRARRGRVRAP